MLSVDTAEEEILSNEGNEEEIFENIVYWMKSVLADATVDWSIDALGTGRTIAEFLHKIDPIFFSKDDFLNKISTFTRADSAHGVKEVSMRKIRIRLSEYYEAVIHRNLEPLADLSEISRDFIRGDVSAAVLFLSTVIGAAFLGPNRETYITGVNSIPKNVMKTLADQITLIQHKTAMLSAPNSPTTSKDPEPNEPNEPLNNGNETEDDKKTTLKIEKLQERNKKLSAERDRLESEVHSLREKLSSEEEGDSKNVLTTQLQELRLKVGVLMDELTVSEIEKSHVKEAKEELDDKNRRLDEKIRDLQNELETVHHLRDEIEIYKEFERKWERSEVQIAQLKVKLDQRENLISDNKLLNERLQTYMNAQMDFEDMQKRNQALQQQLAMAKGELDAKEKAHRELTLNIDKLDYELGVVQERKNGLEEENRRLRSEKDRLEEEMIRHNTSLESNLDESSLHDSMVSALTNNDPAERVSIIEKMMRLEIENSRLKEKADAAENADDLRAQTESLKRTIVELTSDLRISNLKNTELQTKNDALEKNQTDQSTLNGGDRERRVAAEKLEIELAKMRERAQKAESALATQNENVGQEVEMLRKKLSDAEMQVEMTKRTMNEYLEKAKLVITDQEARSQAIDSNGLSRHEFDSLRREIEQKEKRIRFLEARAEQMAMMHEQECRLMTTAWHKTANDLIAFQRGTDSLTESARERESNSKCFPLRLDFLAMRLCSSRNSTKRHFSEEAKRRFRQLSNDPTAHLDVPSTKTSVGQMTSDPPSSPTRHLQKAASSSSSSSSSSAVIIPLVAMRNHGDSILFTKRSMLLKAHRGEVCFPGGRADENETVDEAAIRELEEEIGISRSLVDVWGHLQSIPTRQPASFVTPVVGEIQEEHLQKIKPNFDEVDSVFSASIDELVASTEFTTFCDKKILYTMPIFRIRNFQIYASSPASFVPSMSEIRLWGLSSIMLHFFLVHMYPDRYSNKCFKPSTMKR
ncbi:unnamed protein product, partial [Mesorhabditis belari]|uniref:Nudix hydrolase domain-containing protein n=1 Tax=Mesorhabditis belari TaxID=2138241 RepID=A0AAF3J5N5_9BILA